jgi:hypothetical protein
MGPIFMKEVLLALSHTSYCAYYMLVDYEEEMTAYDYAEAYNRTSVASFLTGTAMSRLPSSVSVETQS